jgi:hypothetical protein
MISFESPQSQNPWHKSAEEMYKELSVAHITTIQNTLNRSGLPGDILNLIDVYIDEGMPGQQERENKVKTLLQEMLLHGADSAESTDALTSLVRTIH